jgi:hypothetical protein
MWVLGSRLSSVERITVDIYADPMVSVPEAAPASLDTRVNAWGVEAEPLYSLAAG